MKISPEWLGRKLSALLGADVVFDDIKISLLGGSIEVVGLKVGEFLTTARAVAKVSVGRALKKEIVVQSLTLERAVVDVRHLPKRRLKKPRDDDDDKTRWRFDVEKVLIVDGRIDFSPKLPVKKLLLELKRSGDAYNVTLLAESIVQIRGTGKILDAADLTRVAESPAEAQLELGDLARVRFTTPRIRSKQGQIEIEGKLTLAQLLALL